MNSLTAHHSPVTTHGADSFGSRLALPAFIVISINVILVVAALAAAGYMRPVWTAALIVGAAALAAASLVVTVAAHRRGQRLAAGRSARDESASAA